jgi:3-isopropylmalate/(R)-2-methylmalate dehydratase small subunit
MIITGKALVMGNNVNTDVLHPSQFFSLDDNKVRAGFLQAAAGYEQTGAGDLSGRIILAGDNFGCGSSRETGARAFVLAGVRAIVARSLARIFSSNVRNLGLPAVECPALPQLTESDFEVGVDLQTWTLEIPAASGIPTDRRQLALKRLDPFWEAVIRAGGLMGFLGFKDSQ